MSPKTYAMISIVTGALSIVPFPFLGWFAPVSLVFALIAIFKKQVGKGIAGLILAAVGFATSPMLWAVGLQGYCMFADCKKIVEKAAAPVVQAAIEAAQTASVTQAGQPVPASPNCSGRVVNYSSIPGWASIKPEGIDALHGVADIKEKPFRWVFVHKNNASGSVYYHDSFPDQGKGMPDLISQSLAKIKEQNPSMNYSKTESQTPSNYPLTLVRFSGMANGRSEVAAFIDSPCFKMVHVLTSPSDAALAADYGAFSKAILDMKFN